MGAVNINKFIGEAPKLSAELLPQNAAQIASNVKLYSGNLVPYNQSSLNQTLIKTGPIASIYPLNTPTNTNAWMHWSTDVDVVRAPIVNNAVTQRVYYTGDTAGNGEPKATTYTMATTGASTAYPYAYYSLGLPAPLAACVATAGSPVHLAGPSQITSIVGGTGSVVTVTTASAHGMNTSAYVTIAGITSNSSFNVTNAQITVTSATTFTYFANGTASLTATIASGTTIDLTGLQLARTYVYTWLTAWGEESAPSPVSNTVYLYEGTTVTITGIPTALPTTGVYAGMTFQTGGAATTVTNIVNNGSGLFRVTSAAHGLSTGVRTVIAGAGGVSTANGNWVVTVIDANTFDLQGSTFAGTYTTGGTSTQVTMLVNVYRTVTSTTGTVYYLAGQVSLGTSTFTDSQPISALTTTLPSTTWYPPPVGLTGIRAIHNNMLVGFTGTTVCFSEPGQPHSWPVSYYQNIGRTVVAVGTVGTMVVVLTDSNPWIIQGNTPAAMQKVRLDTNMPCTSKRGMVNMDWGLCFPTRGGVAVFSALQGGSLATSFVYDWDNFRTIVDPTTITATRYNNKYMASHSKGVFIFEKDDKTGGFLTETTQQFTAVYYDANQAFLYFAFGNPSTLYLWDDPTQPYTQFQWKSKIIRTQDYMNLGAARVIANFAGGTNTTAANVIIQQNNITLISSNTVGGALAGNGNRFGPSPTGTQNDIGASLAGVPLAGSRLKPLLANSSSLTFYLYVNGTLAMTAPVVSDIPFRLPTGYRVDKFEVQVTGNAPVVSVQLAETMQGLKAV